MNDHCDCVPVKQKVDEAIKSSCRMLALREHSQKQLRVKLEKKGFASTVIDSCINYLIAENWQSNERFCNVYIRSMANKGRGLSRIRAELVQQEIPRCEIEKQLLEEDIDWQAACLQVLAKKLGIIEYSLDYLDSEKPNSDEYEKKVVSFADKIKLESFLKYRGFSREQIIKALKLLVITE